MRRYLVGFLVISVASASILAAACGDGSNGNLSSGGVRGSSNGGTTDPDAGFVDDGGGLNDGINTTGVGAGTGANTGLPCDVQQLLENRCIGCHLGPSPKPLLTYSDLLAPS